MGIYIRAENDAVLWNSNTTDYTAFLSLYAALMWVSAILGFVLAVAFILGLRRLPGPKSKTVACGPFNVSLLSVQN